MMDSWVDCQLEDDEGEEPSSSSSSSSWDLPIPPPPLLPMDDGTAGALGGGAGRENVEARAKISLTSMGG